MAKKKASMFDDPNYVVAEEGKPEEKKPGELTYLGPGPLSGEYRFAEIAGSIAASSEEDAKEKAREIALKHPNLLIK